MEIDPIYKVATLFLGTFGAAKILYEVSMGKRSRMRDEYKFAKEFLEDVQLKMDMHPFLKEKGYQAIAGDSQIGGDEIEYLLSLKKPERALRDYVLGKPYLEHFPKMGNLQINFKKKYESKTARGWRIYLYGALYFICAAIAFLPLLFPGFLGLPTEKSLGVFAISLPVFGTYAWFALRAGSRIYRAQMLVTHQARHTQGIVLPDVIQKSQFQSELLGK